MKRHVSGWCAKASGVGLAALFLSVAPRVAAEGGSTARAVQKAAAGAATTRKERKKVQEVDLKRLEIQGRLEDPASVFVLESGGLLLPGLDVLKGILPGEHLPSVEKEAMDHEVVRRIEGEMGVAKR